MTWKYKVKDSRDGALAVLSWERDSKQDTEVTVRGELHVQWKVASSESLIQDQVQY